MQSTQQPSSQKRVPTRRIAQSYVPQHLDRALTLLWCGFALFPLFFVIFPLFPLVFFFSFVAWFLCFSYIISVFMFSSSVFPLFSLSISLNSINNLPILLTNRVTFLVFTFSPDDRSYVGSRSWLHCQQHWLMNVIQRIIVRE